MTEPIVTISAGQLRGKRTEHGVAFLGVPYAEAAVGPARFQQATPRTPWDGIRDATTHGPTSLQSAYPAGMDAILPSAVCAGDDYLNVAVWTPDPSVSGLPVMVWIHGGAFVRGANSIATYDGDAFARDGVVLVSINYRLGVAGFSVLPDAPTNLGLRDQLAALRWVQENIAAFGGNPNNVTIFGESAGGMSVATLLASPHSPGLFHRAIVQSGGGVSVATADDLANVTRAVAESVGCEPTAAELGDVDPERLLAAQDEVSLKLMLDPDPSNWGLTTITGGFGIMPTFPVIDGDVVTDVPERVIAAGQGAQVPLLVGSNSQEFNLWGIGLGMGADTTDDTLVPTLARFGVPEAVTRGYGQRRPDVTAPQVYSDVLTDLLFTGPAIRLAEGHGRHAAVHMYEFDWSTKTFDLGSCHALEIPFVFDTLASGASTMSGPDAPQRLASFMHHAWVRFASGDELGWPTYQPNSRAVRVFADQVVTQSDPRADDRRAWTQS